MEKFYIYDSNKAVKFTNAFADKFDCCYNVSFYFQGIEDIYLRDDVDNEYALLVELMRDYTYEDYLSCIDTSDHTVIMTQDEYKDHIASSVHYIDLDDILKGDFDQTVFYDLLVKKGYIKELN